MATLLYEPSATGAPGIEPRWTRSSKDVVGTAYSSVSKVWFTTSAGVMNEIYFPTIDQPQVRDFQFLISDGETFFHEERRNLKATTEYISDSGLGVRIESESPCGRYRIVKEIVSDPHQPSVLIDTHFEGDPEFLRRLKVYALLAPHLGVGGWGNSGNVARFVGHEFLTANRDGIWLAMCATVPFSAMSCGFVGATDGWQDVSHDFTMDYRFASAINGNIALTGELELARATHFTLGISFGRTLHRATTTLFQSLGVPFEEHRTRFVEQWERATRSALPLDRHTGDDGKLYRRSRELLLAHEDKSYPGAMIASLSIPWGEAKSDDDLGGYHLVWTRDMVNSVTGLLASGDTSTPLRALIYLACSQQRDGGFPQNFWIDGEPYWSGIQLDEVAFPIMLAWRLHRFDGLKNFDPYPMVRLAALYLITHGPATPQERWEENSGYSPSTLASNIAALICAGCFARHRGDATSAELFEHYADFLEQHIEKWTVTNAGTLVPGIKRHFVRINPVDVGSRIADQTLDGKLVAIRNREPGQEWQFPVAEIVDGGFLELVRYGIRAPADAIIEDSIRVIDSVLKSDLPQGPCWRRYSHDGYGQCDDGGPYTGFGRGRPWPLLTGERGHYELAAGRDPMPYLRAMERFSNATRLLPEQVWDADDIPEQVLFRGRQTGSATPLMWAHAEYIKLVRSAADGTIFDLIPEVASRYLTHRKKMPPLEVWKHNWQLQSMAAGTRVRVSDSRPFRLHYSLDEWTTTLELDSRRATAGREFADVDVPSRQRAPMRFTFHYLDNGAWEGRDFSIAIESD
jgi:glucoamylase